MNISKIMKIILHICWIIIIFKIIMIYFFSTREYQEWFCEKKEQYEIRAEQKNTIYSNEETPVRITVHIEGKKSEFETYIDNKGKKLDVSNYRLEFKDDYIKLELLDCRGDLIEIFRFYNSDYLRNFKGEEYEKKR